MERPPTGPKVVPKLAHRSRVAMMRKKTAQAPSVLATTTVLSALIGNERFQLIAMVVGMRIVAHNGTELARWTCTSTQSQLFSLLCSLALCIADLHICRSTVHSWYADHKVSACTTREQRTPSTCVCLTDRQEPNCTVAVFFVNRIVSLTSQTMATICFSSGRSRKQRCSRCRCVV